MESEKYRLQVWFTGHVQGVGFRYKSSEIAKGFDIGGFVENLDDGRVHLEASGDKREVREFVEEIKRVMTDFIRDIDEREDSVSKKYCGFQIVL